MEERMVRSNVCTYTRAHSHTHKPTVMHTSLCVSVSAGDEGPPTSTPGQSTVTQRKALSDRLDFQSKQMYLNLQQMKGGWDYEAS